MTFLEHVCERLMGRPVKPGGSEGESYWLCPFHGDNHPSFHTLPRKPEYMDRWRCFGCGPVSQP
jgi:DNA primase